MAFCCLFIWSKAEIMSLTFSWCGKWIIFLSTNQDGNSSELIWKIYWDLRPKPAVLHATCSTQLYECPQFWSETHPRRFFLILSAIIAWHLRIHANTFKSWESMSSVSFYKDSLGDSRGLNKLSQNHCTCTWAFKEWPADSC